jgi:hypothetical protein
MQNQVRPQRPVHSNALAYSDLVRRIFALTWELSAHLEKYAPTCWLPQASLWSPPDLSGWLYKRSARPRCAPL